MSAFGDDLHLAKLTPEFARFQAILGWRIKDTAQWAPFARLVALHGWKRLIRAAEQCEPGARWPSDMERLCQQYQRDQAQMEREAEERERIAALPKPTDHAARAALFREIMARHGVGPDNAMTKGAAE